MRVKKHRKEGITMKKIGFIGYGLRSETMMKAFTGAGLPLAPAAVAAPRLETLQPQLARDGRFADTRYYADAEEMLDREALDAVFIGTRCGLHARYAAHTKTYLYRIHNHPIDSPFDAAYYTRVPRRLDESAMQAAAQQFVGTHDFLALCAAGSSAAAHGDTVRTITDCHVTRRGDEVDIEVTADGYLYNMVRILAGTLCEVGAGRLRAADIPAILASRDRSRAGPTLPAKGLFLKRVEYPERKEEQL